MHWFSAHPERPAPRFRGLRLVWRHHGTPLLFAGKACSPLRGIDNEGRKPVLVLVLDESHELSPDVLGMLRILTNFDMDSRLVLSLVIAGQSPLRTLLARDDQEAMARRIAHYAQLRLLSREELAQYVAHRGAGAARVPFDARTLDALFEIGRGNCAPPTTSRSSRSTTPPPPATPPSPSSTSSAPARICGHDCPRTSRLHGLRRRSSVDVHRSRSRHSRRPSHSRRAPGSRTEVIVSWFGCAPIFGPGYPSLDRMEDSKLSEQPSATYTASTRPGSSPSPVHEMSRGYMRNGRPSSKDPVLR